jgi:hypothetical protein
MRRTTITLLALLALASISIVVVLAANPHYKKAPIFSDNGSQATATGSITGLGNGAVIITLDFPNATGTTTCTNPGGNEAAGQNPATPADASGSQFFPGTKNGNLSFIVTTAVPAPPTPQAAGCPNGNWTAAFNDITFGCGTLTVQQETFQGSNVYNVVSSLTLTPCL